MQPPPAPLIPESPRVQRLAAKQAQQSAQQTDWPVYGHAFQK
jgi:hypothetical protein